MDITYISDGSTPSHVPNSLQVVKTCEYLAKNKNNVTLIIPNTAKSSTPINSFYNVKYSFRIERLYKFSKNPKGINYYLYTFFAVIKSLRSSDLIISRNFFVIFLCIIFQKKCILEIGSTNNRLTSGLLILNFFSPPSWNEFLFIGSKS